MDTSYIEKAIQDDDVDSIKNAIQEEIIDFESHSYLNLALTCRSFHCFVQLIHIVHIVEKESFFSKCISSSLPLALAYLENNEFEYKNNMTHYEHYVENSFCFPDESLLPRYFKPITYLNNKETCLGQLMYASLRTIIPSDFEALTYLIENRKELGILDKHIVQYFIEGNSFFREENNEQLTQILTLLLDNKVDFSSDNSGFLIQIAAVNNLYDMIYLLSENGSSIENFMQRYQDINQWLNEEEQKQLYDIDYNHDRQYDIYKKFDEENQLSSHCLKKIESILYYKKLNQEIPEKHTEYTQPKI